MSVKVPEKELFGSEATNGLPLAPILDPWRVDAEIGQKEIRVRNQLTNCRPTRNGRSSVNSTTQILRRRMWMGWTWSIYSVSFNPACPQFYSTHFASLDTPGPLLHRSALTSTFIDIWNSIDRSSSLLPLFLRLLPDFHLHRHRHYHCSMNPYHPCRRLFYALISLASHCTIHLPRYFHPPHLLPTISEYLPLLRVQTLFMTRNSRDPGSRPSL